MLNRIKTFVKGKRIVEINGRFIPQLRVKKKGWSLTWEWHGVSATEYSDRTEYRLVEHLYEQSSKCFAYSKDKAAQHLYGYLERQRMIKHANKQIIHDVEPEVWVKLKDKT